MIHRNLFGGGHYGVSEDGEGILLQVQDAYDNTQARVRITTDELQGLLEDLVEQESRILDRPDSSKETEEAT